MEGQWKCIFGPRPKVGLTGPKMFWAILSLRSVHSSSLMPFWPVLYKQFTIVINKRWYKTVWKIGPFGGLFGPFWLAPKMLRHLFRTLWDTSGGSPDIPSCLERFWTIRFFEIKQNGRFLGTSCRLTTFHPEKGHWRSSCSFQQYAARVDPTTRSGCRRKQRFFLRIFGPRPTVGLGHKKLFWAMMS